MDLERWLRLAAEIVAVGGLVLLCLGMIFAGLIGRSMRIDLTEHPDRTVTPPRDPREVYFDEIV